MRKFVEEQILARRESWLGTVILPAPLFLVGSFTSYLGRGSFWLERGGGLVLLVSFFLLLFGPACFNYRLVQAARETSRRVLAQLALFQTALNVVILYVSTFLLMKGTLIQPLQEFSFTLALGATFKLLVSVSGFLMALFTCAAPVAAEQLYNVRPKRRPLPSGGWQPGPSHDDHFSSY